MRDVRISVTKSGTIGHVTGFAGRLAALGLVAVLVGGCDALRGPRSLVSSGRADLERGDAIAAIAAAKHAIEKDPSYADARLLLIDAALLQNDGDTVGQQLDKVRNAGAGPADLLPREWAVLRSKNDFEALLRSVAGAPATVPEVLRHRYEGYAQLGLGQAAPAIEAFRRALALDAADADSITGLAQAEFLAGERQAAISILREASTKYPRSARIALALGQASRAVGQLADAEAAFGKAAAASSPRGDWNTWFMASAARAEIALAQARYPAADAAVAALAKGAPNAVATRLLQARLALAERRYDEAARYAQAVVQAIPNDVPARMLLAYITYAQGYLQQAESALDGVLTDRPDFVPARRLLAEIQLAGNRAEVARRTIDPLLGATADGDTLALAGRIATALGETTEAEGYFGRAVDGSGTSDSLKLKIAAQYLAAGKSDRAIAILAKLPGGGDLAERRDLLLALAKAGGDSAEAGRAEIEAVATRYGADPALQRSVAMMHAARGDFDAARSRLEGWLKTHPDDADSYLVLGRIEVAARRYDEADRALREVLARQPKNVPALIEQAAVAMLRGDVDGAVKTLESARSADPKAIEPRISLARIYLARDTAAARALELAGPPLKEALALDPKRVDTLILSAVAEKRAGHDAEAERILTDALKADAASPSLWLSLGELQATGNHLDEARDSFRKALGLSPGWLPAVKALAAVDVRRGEFQEALDATYKAREIGGLSAGEAREQRAGALLLEGDVHATAAAHEPARARDSWVRAAASYAKADEASPSLASAARLLRARVLAGLPDPDGPMSRWVRQHPGDIAARGMLATYYGERNEKAKAIALYEQGLALTPTQAPLLNNLAWLYFETGDGRAQDTARRAVQYSQRQPAILDTLGWILVRQGKAGEGVTYLAEAHRGAPRAPDIGYHYAEALAATGKAAEARATLEDLLKDPQPFAARAEATALLARLKAG
jgi:putative PEP-CTERM system TPR-repeat lipoprotein